MRFAGAHPAQENMGFLSIDALECKIKTKPICRRGGRFMIPKIGALLLFLFSFMSANLYAQVYTWANFPQFAAGGGWTTYITISDPLQDGGARAVGVLFYDPSGKPLTVTVSSDLGVIQAPDFEFDLDDLEEITFTVTSGTPVTGRIEIYAKGVAKFNSSVRYTNKDAFGNIIDVVGVLPSNLNNNWTITLDKQDTWQHVGVAIANWYSNTPLTVNFELYKNGGLADTTTREIPAMGQLATYVDDAGGLFPLFTGMGTLRISCPQAAISVMATRDDGGQFSSLPADAGAQLWSWTYTASSTTYTGYWSWKFTDEPTFVGSEHNFWNNDLITVRGVYNTTYNPFPFFALEWWYVNSDTDPSDQGTILFQGSPGTENGKEVVNGTRLSVNAGGEVQSSTSFKATRIY